MSNVIVGRDGVFHTVRPKNGCYPAGEQRADFERGKRRHVNAGVTCPLCGRVIRGEECDYCGEPWPC